MSLSSTTPRQAYAGDGSTTDFSVPFQFFDSSDLKVYLTNTSTFAETLQVLDSDYLVTGGNGTTGTVSFVMAPASTYTVSIVYNPAITQDVDLEEDGPIPAEDLEQGLDKIAAVVKRLNDSMNRALRQPETEITGNIGRLPVKTDRASKFLAFDSSGDPIASAGNVDSAVPVSAFMETVLDDTTASAALTTLGISTFIKTLLDDVDAGTAQSTLGLSTYFKTLLAAATAAALRTLLGFDGSGNVTKSIMDSTSTLLNGELGNLGLACSVGSSALTVTLTDAAGATPSAASPVSFVFRNATAATGTVSQVRIATTKTVVVSSGSTLGHASGKNEWIYVYALLFSGAVELAVSSILFDEGSVRSTTAEGGAGAADSATALYSTTARSNVPIRLIGRMKSNQTTAGTWAAVPTEISLPPFNRPAPIVIAYRSTNQSISTGTSTDVVYDTTVVDNYSAYDNATGIFTAPEKAIYEISTALSFAVTTAFNGTSEAWAANLYIDGSDNGQIFQTVPPSSNFNLVQTIRTIISLNQGQTAKIRVVQDSGSSHNIVGAATTLVSFRKVA